MSYSVRIDGIRGGYVPMILTFAEQTRSSFRNSEISATLRVKCPYGGGETLILTTSKASYHMNAIEDAAPALVASDYKDPQIVVRGGVT